MAGMISDTESMKRFQNELLDAVDNLREQLKRTDQAMETVAEEWKDSQFQKYQQEFTKDKEKIEPICKDIEEFEGEVLDPMRRIMERYLDL